MKKQSILSNIVSLEQDNIVVMQLLDQIDKVLYYFDDFTDEIYSDVFYCLFLDERKYTYLEISLEFCISNSKIYEIKGRIENYAKKLILTKKEYASLKKYL